MMKTNGMYCSKGEIREEWHAGICFRMQKYNAIIFTNDMFAFKKTEWIYLDKESNVSEFIKKILAQSQDKNRMVMNGFWTGRYSNSEKTIQISFRFKDNSFDEEYTVLSQETLLDENLLEYNFIQF